MKTEHYHRLIAVRRSRMYRLLARRDPAWVEALYLLDDAWNKYVATWGK